MGERPKSGPPFHFLSDSEFLALDSKTRVDYLTRAQKALLDERERLKALAQEHIRKQQEGG
jgi:hypothetical protein